MLAYYLHDLDPIIFRVYDNIGPRWYGLAYVLAFICGYALLGLLAKRGYADLPASRVGDFVTGCALFGVIIGGRLGYVFFYKPEMLREPLSILRVWEGGMSSHGGMIGLLLFTLYYAHRHKLSWTNLADNLGVTAPLGLFFGRCANFINGELYGRAANAVHREWHVKEVLRTILTPRHPSQLYEALFEGVILFAILWIVRTRTRQPNGVLAGLFFICYAIFRIVIETFREPDATLIAGFTRGQFFSFFLIAIGVAFVVAAKMRPTFPKRTSGK